jgi:hypothetical protein
MTPKTIFDPASLQKHVDAALSSLVIPPGKRGVVVAYARLDGTVGMAAVMRINGVWSVGATFQLDIERGIQGEFDIKATF